MNKKVLYFPLFLILLLFQGEAMAFILKSSAFKHETVIPTKYTCDGANISPPLSWEDTPADTKSFVLILEDPDAPAGTWDHWVLFNIPAKTNQIPENVRTLPTGTQMGTNSWQIATYRGPCPPDREHRYFFKIYALDGTLSLSEGATKSEIQKAMNKHVLGTSELITRYDRKRK